MAATPDRWRLHYDALDVDEVTIRRYGDCAIATARGTARGHLIPEATRITLITVKDDGDRRLAGIHFSFIAGTAGAPGPPGAS